MKELASWVSDTLKYSIKEKEDIVNGILEEFGSLSKEAMEIAKDIEAQREYRKLSFITHLYYVPITNSRKNKVNLLRFNAPAIMVSHRSLPILMVIHNESLSNKVSSIDDIESSFTIKQNLSWIKVLSHMNPTEKRELFFKLIDGIKFYRKRKDAGKKWLSDFLVNENEFTLVGFSVNISYINVDPKWGDTNVLWIHPWGTPQLLMNHENLPCMIIVGPSIRLNENILGEKNMEGYTG